MINKQYLRGLMFVAGGVASAVLAGCVHRSVAELSGVVPLAAGTTRIRLEIEDGSVKVLTPGAGGLAEAGSDSASDATPVAEQAGSPGVVRYRGGVRRGANTAEELKTLEGVPLAFESLRDPERPEVLVLRTPRRPAGSLPGTIFGCEFVMELPASLALEVEILGSGHITVEDRVADVMARTGRGDLRASRCTGALSMETGTGMTIVYDHTGIIDMQALVGDMQIFVREPNESIRLVTGQGNVQCLVPTNTGFRVDARTETGKVANGFGIENRRDGYTSTMLGTRGDGRIEIVLRSSSGHLSLSHKDWE